MITVPVGDTAPARRFPLVNFAIVAACTVAYGAAVHLLFFSDATPRAIEQTLDRYALIPARFLALAARGQFAAQDFYLPLVSSPFLHLVFLHFLSNMLFLWVLGDGVEDRFGHLGYALLYGLGSLFASLAHVAAHPKSELATLGASGGIATVMGAYLLLYPRAWIDFRLAPFPWPRFQLPALLVLLGWLALQVMAGIVHHPAVSDPGVALWAHLGGFTFGAAAVIVCGRKAPSRARAKRAARRSRP